MTAFPSCLATRSAVTSISAMQHPPAGRRSSSGARAVLAGTVAAGITVLAALAGLAVLAGPAAASQGRAQQPAAPVSVVITSVSPQFATPRATVRVSGRV